MPWPDGATKGYQAADPCVPTAGARNGYQAADPCVPVDKLKQRPGAESAGRMAGELEVLRRRAEEEPAAAAREAREEASRLAAELEAARAEVTESCIAVFLAFGGCVKLSPFFWSVWLMAQRPEPSRTLRSSGIRLFLNRRVDTTNGVPGHLVTRGQSRLAPRHVCRSNSSRTACGTRPGASRRPSRTLPRSTAVRHGFLTSSVSPGTARREPRLWQRRGGERSRS